MEEASVIYSIIDAWSYLGIFGLALISNTFPLVPEEVFMLALGYIGSTSAFNLYYIGGIAFLGLAISDCVIFYLSRTGAKFYMRVVKKLLGDRFEKVTNNSFTKRHIGKIIFGSRFVIQVRFIGPFLAGHHRVSWKTFLLYDLAALALYVPLILFVGSYFQDRVVRILDGVGVVKNVIVISAILLILIIIMRSIQKGLLRSMYESKHARRLRGWFGFTSIGKSKDGEEK